MANRYSKFLFPQPIRTIPVNSEDIIKTFKQYDTLDGYAQKYYEDPTLSWVIMCANPNYFNEFEIKAGDKVRIPMPIERVWRVWGEHQEI